MHVLLITSEELNESDIYSSCFEISQARSLQNKNIKVGILSVGSITVKNLLRSLFLRIRNKTVIDHRLSPLGTWSLLQLTLLTSIRAVLVRTKTRKLKVQGLTVYESLISGFGDFFVNHHVYRKCVKSAIKTARVYIKDQGRPDVIHAHSRFLLASMIALKIKNETGIPYVITEHSTFYLRQPPDEAQKKLLHQAITNSSGLITVSHKLAEIMRKSLGKSYEYVCIPNIIDEIFENEIPNGKPARQSFSFLNIGALNGHKGHEYLLRAFSLAKPRIPGAILKIAGDGDDLKNLKELSSDLGIENSILFLGQLHPVRLREVLLDSGCLVVSSEFETFGVVVIEAHSCGKPVISTRCGGPEEIINDTNGMLVPVNDVQELAMAMEKMYREHDRFDAAFIRKDCINKYGQETIGRQLIENYKIALNGSDNNN